MALPYEDSISLTTAYIHLKHYEWLYTIPLTLYSVKLLGFYNHKIKGRLLMISIFLYQMVSCPLVKDLEEKTQVYQGVEAPIFGVVNIETFFWYPFFLIPIIWATCSTLSWYNPLFPDNTSHRMK